jgi:hypothetical protein
MKVFRGRVSTVAPQHSLLAGAVLLALQRGDHDPAVYVFAELLSEGAGDGRA